MSGSDKDPLTWLDRFAKARVAVVGDLMLDRFVYGSVDRISPEGPIPILRVRREAAMLGGAGNVVRNLAALGASSALVSVVGNDAAADELRELLTKEAGVAASLIEERGRTTTIKTRYIGGAQQLLRADRESEDGLNPKTRRAVIARAAAALKRCAVVVLSDYGKGVLADGVAAELIAAARRAGKPTVIDPKGIDYSVYAGADMVTPNQRELSQATGMPSNSDAEVESAARTLIGRYRFGAVLATRSSRGMMLIPAKGKVLHVRAEAREVFDVAGAGDTVIAAIAAAMAAGAPLDVAAMLGNAAAGIVVGKVGTAAVSPVELRQTLSRQRQEAGAAKIASLQAAMALAARWRRGGLRVGFTNGCFDLLHPGHVSLLRQARAGCDRLIVGLNSDRSVRRLKGVGRPVQDAAARSAVLASLSDVDAVIVFEQETPIALIEALRPDVLVKGADYTEATVVGSQLVRSSGGQILLAQLSPGHSTTCTLKRLASRPQAKSDAAAASQRSAGSGGEYSKKPVKKAQKAQKSPR